MGTMKKLLGNLQPPREWKASPEESADWEKQKPGNQYLCPANHHKPCLDNKLVKGGDRDH